MRDRIDGRSCVTCNYYDEKHCSKHRLPEKHNGLALASPNSSEFLAPTEDALFKDVIRVKSSVYRL